MPWSKTAKFSVREADTAQTSFDFKPMQFHFHSPSEHTVEGEHKQAELHIVHKNSAGKYGVLGILFDKEAGTDENLFLKSVINAFKTGEDKDDQADDQIDLRKLLTSSLDLQNYWTYDGSFTTPPCTEDVVWTVIKQVQSISPAQLAEF